jgi:hypothetical protein
MKNWVTSTKAMTMTGMRAVTPSISLPAPPCPPGTVDGCLRGRLRSGRQIPCRRHRILRRTRLAEFVQRPAGRGGHPGRHKIARTGHSVDGVKIFMTSGKCQIFLYVPLFPAGRARPSAPRRVPATSASYRRA